MLGEKLKRIDIFGANVDLFYKGQARFHTHWGCSVTFCVIIVYMVVVSLKWIEFFGETDPIEHFSEAGQDLDQQIDLQSLGFTFAVDNLDAKIGTV